MHIAAAAAEDVDALAVLLQEAALPARHIEEHLEHFLVLRDEAAVWGCGGLEVYADSCLLRSFAVASALRGGGWGSRLLQELLVRARRLGAKEVIALTATAAPFFQRFGFTEIEREKISTVVRTSWQFSEAGCACATTLHLAL